MRVLRVSLPFTAFILMFLLMACPSKSTNFSTVWKDETYQGRPGKILVVSAFPDPVTRKIFEDEFVKELKDRGMDAVPSYTVMPDLVVSDKDAIAVEAKGVGADTLLINISRDATQLDKFVAGGQIGDWYIHIQTDVYNIKSQRSIMNVSAVVHIVTDKTRTDQIQSYIKDLVNMLSQHKLL